MNWVIRNNILIKDCGEIQYQIIYKEPLLKGLEGEFIAWKMECSLVASEVISSNRLETCIKACNQQIKQEQ